MTYSFNQVLQHGHYLKSLASKQYRAAMDSGRPEIVVAAAAFVVISPGYLIKLKSNLL